MPSCLSRLFLSYLFLSYALTQKCLFSYPGMALPPKPIEFEGYLICAEHFWGHPVHFWLRDWALTICLIEKCRYLLNGSCYRYSNCYS